MQGGQLAGVTTASAPHAPPLCLLFAPPRRFDLAVTLDTYLVTYPTYGTLGFTWPALPV